MSYSIQQSEVIYGHHGISEFVYSEFPHAYRVGKGGKIFALMVNIVQIQTTQYNIITRRK